MELDAKLTNEHKLSLEHLVQGMEDLSIECEFDDHGVDWEAHHGETLWYMQVNCSHCPASSGLLAACTGWRDWMHSKDHDIICASCERKTPAWNAVYICKRIDGNW